MTKLRDACAHEIMDLTPHIVQVIRVEMRRGHGADISIPQFRTLGFIQRNPETSLSSLAEHLGLTLPSVSKLIAGLVKQKLVSRETSKADRRKLTLALTKAGASILDAARVRAQEHLAKKLNRLSDQELGTIDKAMQLLNPIFIVQPSEEL